ncbi:UNKNOWN [Stylonychia lemnae]|uniref:Uncharacterized protein n=1 Tax=Stylonychia lemnae TaxID=5949 RepID=A0A078B5W7_STYLE|nr:UNKNOWN [Stylonychia lemnae]|eukprot:CDW89819.1 UNKNOWN [Stylonychia lemnae]
MVNIYVIAIKKLVQNLIEICNRIKNRGNHQNKKFLGYNYQNKLHSCSTMTVQTINSQQNDLTMDIDLDQKNLRAMKEVNKMTLYNENRSIQIDWTGKGTFNNESNNELDQQSIFSDEIRKKPILRQKIERGYHVSDNFPNAQ